MHSFDDYMKLTVTKCLKIYKKYDHKIINKFKYIFSTRPITLDLLKI
jgi:hypothetical protein